MMTKLEILIDLYHREKFNLSCYSSDYLSEKAKKGFEFQYAEHKEIIGDYEEGDKMADILFWLFLLFVSWVISLFE